MVRSLVRHADVLAVLADPAFVPPPAAAGFPVGTTGWLRATVARFSAGPDHTRRRDLARTVLDRADPAQLRTAAAALAATTAGRSIAAWRVPLTVLGAALEVGYPGWIDDIAAVAPGYRSAAEPPADDAVARLVTGLGTSRTVGATADGPADGEVIAAWIGVLVQAYAATATLIDNAVAADPDGAVPPDRLLAEVARFDPPVRSTWRMSPAGELVELDLAGANRDRAVWRDPDTFDPGRPAGPHLTFGGPPRVCPGRDHALAIAAGVLEGLRA
jgi:cytochrome P450